MSHYSRKSSSTTTQTKNQNSVHGIIHDFGSNQEQNGYLNSTSPQDIVSDALNWGGLLLTKADDLSNNSLEDIIPCGDLNGSLAAASALMSGVQSYQDSPNQTILGKGLDALLDVSGSLMVGANPVVGAVDTLLPEGIKISELYDGTSSAISSMAEGLFTGDASGMEGFMDKAKNGDYSIVLEEAVKSGEFWAKQLQ